jgi:hypothetical protein
VSHARKEDIPILLCMEYSKTDLHWVGNVLVGGMASDVYSLMLTLDILLNMHITLIHYLESAFLAHPYTKHGTRCDSVGVSNVSKDADLAAPGHRDSSSGVDW